MQLRLWNSPHGCLQSGEKSACGSGDRKRHFPSRFWFFLTVHLELMGWSILYINAIYLSNSLLEVRENTRISSRTFLHV